MLTVDELIHFYQLQPHPEGGYYKETYRATERISSTALPPRFAGERSFSTGIYFLLQAGQFSAFHRIQSDEMWHFYEGESLDIYVINSKGELEIIRLGRDVTNGETFQAVVPAGCWFASQPAAGSSYSFVGCTVAPGFDFADFEMAQDAHLLNDYPQHESIIRQLCR